MFRLAYFPLKLPSKKHQTFSKLLFEQHLAKREEEMSLLQHQNPMIAAH